MIYHYTPHYPLMRHPTPGSVAPLSIVAVFLCTVFLCTTASVGTAQTAEDIDFDASLFEPLSWRNIGPERAGRAIAGTGSPSRPLEYYAGFAGGGLWKTEDGGTLWRPVTDGSIRSSSVGAVAVAESDPDVVYIGTGEVQIQRNSLQGDGVYGSRGGGASWTHLGLDDSQVISRIRVLPQGSLRHPALPGGVSSVHAGPPRRSHGDPAGDHRGLQAPRQNVGLS